MNALPLNNNQTPVVVIDDLVANFGLRRVLLVVLARVLRRNRSPDTSAFPMLATQNSVDGLSDHLRKDLGLPPNSDRRFEIELISSTQKIFW